MPQSDHQSGRGYAEPERQAVDLDPFSGLWRTALTDDRKHRLSLAWRGNQYGA